MTDSPFFRPYTQYERKCDFAQMLRVTERTETPLAKALARIVKEAVRDMTKKVRQGRVIEFKRLSVATNPPFKPEYENKFRAVLRAGMKDMLDSGYDQADSEVTGVRKYSMADGVGGLNWSEVNDYLDETAGYVAHDSFEALRKISTPILSEGIRNGYSPNEVMKQLDDAYARAGFDDDFTPFRIETTVRTNVAKVFNEGRAQAFDDMSDQIAAYQYSAIMDGRTSLICEELDGKVFSKQELDIWNPPNHFNCRSVVVPILTGEDYELSPMPNMKLVDGGFLKPVKE